MSEFRRRLMTQMESDPNALPAGCVRCEYIESTGTQYIDTEFINGNRFSVELELYGLETYTSILGGRNGDIRSLILYNSAPSTLAITISSYNAARSPFVLSNLSYSRHVIRVSISDNKGSVWIDDKEYYDSVKFDGDYNGGVPVYLFACNSNGNAVENTRTKAYSLKMWNGDILEKSFIPILDQEGVPCMYDTVNKKFHYNKGTGQFLYKIL